MLARSNHIICGYLPYAREPGGDSVGSLPGTACGRCLQTVSPNREVITFLIKYSQTFMTATSGHCSLPFTVGCFWANAHHGREKNFLFFLVVSTSDSLPTLRVSLPALRAALRGVSDGADSSGNLPDLRCSAPETQTPA